MNPKTFTIILLKIFAIYLFFQAVPILGDFIYSFTESEVRTASVIGYFILQIGIYVISIFALFKFSNPIAEFMLRSIPDDSNEIISVNTSLLRILIAACAVYYFLSAIPQLVSQIYTMFSFYQEELMTQTEKNRITKLVLRFISVVFQIVVSALVFLKSNEIAQFWEKQQTVKE